MTYLIFLLLTVLLYFALQLVMGYIPLLGIIVASIFTLALIIASLQIPRLRNIAALCAVLPVMTVLNVISLMVPSVPPSLLIYGVLHYVSLYFWINLERPVKPSIPWKYYITSAPVMLIIGALMGFGATILLPVPDDIANLGPLIYVCIPVFAIAEELFFRRLLQHEVSKVAGQAIAIIFTVWIATSFTLTDNLMGILLIVATQIVFSVIYSREQSIGPTLVANMAMKATYIVLLHIGR